MSLPSLPSLPSAGGAAPLAVPAAGPEVELAVSGMHCASCVGRIESALGKVPGVSLAVVDLLSGRARVRLARQMSGNTSGTWAHLCATTLPTPPAPIIRTLAIKGTSGCGS